MHHHHIEVIGGVDTHGEVHVAAVVDSAARILGTETFPATGAGYRRLLCWLRRHGTLVNVGVEGTASYGAGLTRYLTGEGVEVVEVSRPDRQRRRRKGKSDTVDAEAAARAALSGEGVAVPKAGDGQVESVRVLRITRRSAIKARTQASNQLRDLIVTAPEQVRCRLGVLSTAERVETCARFRIGDLAEPTEATKAALRITRHRLNRGGDRQANNALWRIVLVRMTCDPRTRAYVERRTSEGKSKKEIIRCLKRHVAREIYRLLTRPITVIDGAELRATRNTAGISLDTAAKALSSWPIRLSRLERGLVYDTDLARRYNDWLRTAA